MHLDGFVVATFAFTAPFMMQSEVLMKPLPHGVRKIRNMVTVCTVQGHGLFLLMTQLVCIKNPQGALMKQIGT